MTMIAFVLKRASGTSVAVIVVPFFAIAFVVAATAWAASFPLLNDASGHENQGCGNNHYDNGELHENDKLCDEIGDLIEQE